MAHERENGPMGKHKPIPKPPDAFDKLVDAVTKEVTKRLRPAPAASCLTFRVIRIRAGKMGNICDLVIGWVPPASGATVQHFAASVTPGTASAPPIPLSVDLGPTVSSQVITGVADGSSVQASVIEDNGIVQAPALTGSYTVNLTAPGAATGMTFTPTNVRPEDGSSPTLASAAPAATPPASPPETAPPAA
jgi:hypothetical protein